MEMLYPVPDKCQGDGGGVHGNGGGGGQGNYLVYGCAPIYTFNLIFREVTNIDYHSEYHH